jgi:AbrB family looped-hinge helix DNA binding protein
MAHAVISPKFQVVIPKAIRRDAGLQSGQVVQIVSKGGVISLVPDQPVGRMRGYLKGMRTSALREKKDRA